MDLPENLLDLSDLDVMADALVSSPGVPAADSGDAPLPLAVQVVSWAVSVVVGAFAAGTVLLLAGALLFGAWWLMFTPLRIVSHAFGWDDPMTREECDEYATAALVGGEPVDAAVVDACHRQANGGGAQ